MQHFEKCGFRLTTVLNWRCSTMQKNSPWLPGRMIKADVDALRAQGVDDGEILEANQIVCYFNYVNRCLNGLGVTTDGDVVG